MNLLIEGSCDLTPAVLREPGVAGIAHRGEQPRARVHAVKAIKKFKRAQRCLLHHILGIMLVARQPAGQIIRRIKMRQYGLFETLQFLFTSQR